MAKQTDGDRFHRIEALFHKAKVLAPADRASYLDESCGTDLDLRAEVESLLAHADRGTGDMSLRPGDEGKTTLTDRGPLAEGPGTRIGCYKILQQIGEGGFGAVYMAEQEHPVQRKVALKIIKLGMDTKQVIARFEAERQALALMDHPNIAKVLEAGATETGRPYFVMELVKGIPITEYCDKNKLTTRQRLDLFLQICHAVQHAHQKGIIHRDLKPSNVLVTLHDARPVPKVIDFGIAKATSRRLTEKTLFTEFRQFIGTPEYMSPDQAEISGLDVDTRTDIYSLGVILYELLTGTTPFDAATLRGAGHGEMQRIILEDDPPKPSTRMETLGTTGGGENIARHHGVEPSALSRLIRGDLDWIVMKAMEKDRTRRYQSASELATDVERHLRSEPVSAGPPSVIYKFRKFVNRHRLGVVAGLLITAALVIGLSTATYGLFEARREAQRSQRIVDFLQDLFISTDPERAMAGGADLEGVLAQAREFFGDDHATVAAILSSRAFQLQTSGDLEAAEELYRESLRLWRESFGGDNANVGATLTKLGFMQFTKGDSAAAEESLREAVRIIKVNSGTDNLAVCEPLTFLASVYSSQSKIDEAEAALLESVRIREKVAPNQRLQIAVGYLGLSNMMSIAGRPDRVREYAPITIKAWREAVPQGSPLLARIMIEFGIFYKIADEPESAEPLLREGLAMYAKMAAPVDPRFRLIGARMLYDILGDRGDFEETISVAIDAIRVAREFDSTADVDGVVDDLASVAWRLAATPELPRAKYESALEAVNLALMERTDNPPWVNTLGVLKYRLGEYEAALEILAVSHAHYTQEYLQGVPADLAFMAMAHHRLGHEDEAESMMTQLRAAMRDPVLAESADNQQHLAEAEALLSEEDPGQ